MYLTGGQFKGYKIDIPKSARPTLSKIRESIFNILDNLDCGNSFLDMFAGSAIMGLEALSRGYKVKEIEIDKKSAQIIKKNYEKLNTKADIAICDALKFRGETFDIIYIDPPWDYDYKPVLEKAVTLLNENGLMIVEHDIKIDFTGNNLQILKSKKYGRCLIDILRKI